MLHNPNYVNNNHDLIYYRLQQLKHEMEQLEAWMSVRDPQVKDGNVGDSINIVEELLRRQQDFEKTVDAQEEKFTAITRATQVCFMPKTILTP